MKNKNSNTISIAYIIRNPSVLFESFTHDPGGLIRGVSLSYILFAPLATFFKWYNIEAFVNFNPTHSVGFSGIISQWILGIISSFCSNPMAIRIPSGPLLLNSVHWTGLSKCLGFASDIITMIPILLLINCMRQIANQFITDDYFSMNQSKYYRTAGWLALAQAYIAQPLGSALLNYAATINSPKPFFSPSLEVRTFILLILIAAILMMISQMIDRATVFKQELDSTI